VATTVTTTDDGPATGTERVDGLAIGFDIGGTKIAGGVLTSDGTTVELIAPIPTPKDQDGILSTLVDTVIALRERYPSIVAVGAGTAGLVEFPEGFIRWAPNNGYEQMPLRARLEQATGLPVVVDNDANAAAWAEARLGRSAPYMMFVTLGTGVGGGIVLDGQLFRGASGIGAEIGHLIVDPQGDHRCGCGNVGCLEALASGNALGRMGRDAAAHDPRGTLAQLAGSPAAVTGQTVFEAATAGDVTARSLYEQLGFWLGIGLASLTTILDLQLIALGGSVALAGDMLFTPTSASMERYLFAREHRPPPEIVASSLGVEAGWVGAALLALDGLHARPPIPIQLSV
jgi:glucokinase